jgi:lambda repressor-like predicted transcriptional regulator
MMERKNAILRRIHEVRKIMQRNIHDCASFLNITKDDYHKFEQQAELLSLPEMELLARYFGVSPRIFLQDDHWEEQRLEILDDHVQPKYKNLRHKMIRAKINAEIHIKSISLDQIQAETAIDIPELKNYLHEGYPIPLDQLLKICEVVSIPIESLIGPTWPEKTDINKPAPTAHWQQEFPANKNPELGEENVLSQLTLALQKLPKKEQAEVTKFILEKLQTIT